MKRNNKKKKGFTLIELIAVIAILAILAAVIVPKVTSYITDATNTTQKANATTILNSIALYNAQCSTVASIDTSASSTVTMENIIDGQYDATDTHKLDTIDEEKNLVEVVSRATASTKSGISPTTTIANLISYSQQAGK